MSTTTVSTSSSRLTGRDLINLGIFTAIYLVGAFIVGAIGFVPILLLGLPFLIPIVTGIPFMLFATRVTKFGLISLMGVLVGIVMILIGESWLALVLAVVLGVAADLIMRAGGYRSWPLTLLGFGVFSAWGLGAMLPIWVMRDSFLAYERTKMGDEYVDQLAGLTDGWVFWIIVLSLIVGVLIGGYLGRITLRKHFARAGIA